MSLFTVSKQISDLIHDENTDYDAPVKIKLEDGTEYVITDIEIELNVSTGEQVVWASVVEE